jgi:hypothetical protein
MRIRLIRKPANPITTKPMESKQTAVECLYKEMYSMFCTPDMIVEFEDMLKQAKEMEKQQLEKELNRFFLYFRDNGERLLGASIEQLVKSYLKSR